MNPALATFGTNARWEWTRLRRSRRVWLLTIPPTAGPVGSIVADLYLRVPSAGTAAVLGLLITAGLAALVVLDLTALAVGEDLALRSEYLTFALPQPRSPALLGRIGVVVGGTLAAYAGGAVLVGTLADALVAPSPAARAPILIPSHLAVGLVGLLAFLGGVTAAAGVVTRSSAQALVAGVLAGVVALGVGSWFLLERSLSPWFPVVLGLAGILGFGICLVLYERLDA